jgi:HD-GYP domain-containing protein (c-di-GMP phosphodiesterase class II)
MPEPLVVEIMRRGMGTHFDPHLLMLFLTNYEQFREISAANPDEQVPTYLVSDAQSLESETFLSEVGAL